jgi:autotransporter-associated beta strand protein
MKLHRLLSLTASLGLILFVAPGFMPRAEAAGSATWNLSPGTSIWYSASNWTPATVPNTISDTATFGVSNITTLSYAPGGLLSNLGTFAFTSGASAYTINFANNLYPAMIGAGVMNDSGILQVFSIPPSGEFRDINETNNMVSFINIATAGILTQWTVKGSGTGAYRPGELFFNDTATAASATIIVTPGGSDIGGEDGDGYGGILDFRDSSTADHATITVTGGAAGADYGSPPDAYFTDTATAANATITMTGGTIPLGDGGILEFYSNSTAADATIANEGGAVSGGRPGKTYFWNDSTAGDATLIANGGAVTGADGGGVFFYDNATGGAARCELFGNGTLDIGFHLAPGVTVGSVEGDGLILLGDQMLTVGSNNLSTTFSGVISGSGSLTKVGSGTLTLTGANTYTGRTQVKRGTLSIEDRTGGLPVIQGNVAVDGGTFGGRGTVTGAVVVGGVGGRSAVLESNLLHGGNFIIQKSLKFKSGATCKIDLDSNHGEYSDVFAQGVTINEGALFTMKDFGNSSFGAVTLPIIVNTSGTPIVGTFANLPEGGSIVVKQNTFYATYHGNDGNDLILTTVP